jgi:hypothetical protein
VWRPAEVVVTVAVGAAIIGLWWHFA